MGFGAEPVNSSTGSCHRGPPEEPCHFDGNESMQVLPLISKFIWLVTGGFSCVQGVANDILALTGGRYSPYKAGIWD